MSSYTLHRADCFDVFKGIKDNSIDLILTDPPYGITACEWDKKPDLTKFFSEVWRILKPTGTILAFGVEPFSTTLRVACLGKYKYDLYWIKRRGTGFLNAKNAPLKQVEIISVFSKGGVIHKSISTRRMTYNPQGVLSAGKKKLAKNMVNTYHLNPGHISGKEYEAFSNYPTNVLYFSERKDRRFHPTQKPVALLEYLIKTYTNEGETVLDPFMGSGSTGVACVNTGREFIGVELDPQFYEMAEKRLKNAEANNQKHLEFAMS